MEQREVNAIVRSEVLERVEKRLSELRVKGLNVTHVKGYGEYKNFFSRSWFVQYARIQIYTEKSRASEIAQAIIESGHTGAPGDGIVAILPVENIFRIRSKAEAKIDEI